MKKYTLLTFLFLILFSANCYTQYRNELNGFLAGIESGINTSNFRTELSAPNAYGRVFVQSPGRILELGIGYFKFRDFSEGSQSYETDLYNLDLKLGFGSQEGSGSFQLYPLGISLAYVEKLKSPILTVTRTEYEVGKKYDWIVSYTATMNYDVHLNKFMSIGLTLGLNLANGFVLESKDSTTRTNLFYFGTRLVFGSNGFFRDSDGDRITNSDEEEIYRTDPEKADTDGDRVSDYDEIFKYKTDPLKADTDGDGVSDGDELYKYKTNPLYTDTDSDGLNDGDEILQYRTNPLDMDTDGDGISDYKEIFKYKSDPLKSDTDGDGLSDYDEVFTYKTDPALADTDGDGITDRDEIKKFNTDPFKADTDEDGINDRDEIVVYHTNALIADSDGDGIKDYDEIFVYKTKPLVFDTDIDQISDGDEVFKYHTNPSLGDSDNDGLGDYQEIFYYYTNPLLIDSDNSGVDDKTEVERGTDPNDKEDDVIEVNKIIVLEGIEFEFQKATITPESDRRLQKTLKLLQAFPNYNFSLEGHTDDIGGRQFNQKLSLDRAKAVKTWLVNHGINAKRLTVKGFGFDKPVASNSTDEGRQRNRRVEFIRTN